MYFTEGGTDGVSFVIYLLLIMTNMIMTKINNSCNHHHHTESDKVDDIVLWLLTHRMVVVFK